MKIELSPKKWMQGRFGDMIKAMLKLKMGIIRVPLSKWNRLLLRPDRTFCLIGGFTVGMGSCVNWLIEHLLTGNSFDGKKNKESQNGRLCSD